MQPQTNSAKLPIDTVIHLGAGRCSELDSYLDLQCKRIILVEADPQQTDALKIRAGGLPQIEIIQAAVAGYTGPAHLHRFSLPDVNSLRQATVLFALFPGLKKIDRLQVETIDPATLLSRLHLDTRQNCRLIIDLPGVELEVLQVLHQARQLHHFSEIQLHCANQPLYEGSEPAEILLRWLEEQGYDSIIEVDSQDPDRPGWILKRNTQLLRNLEQQEQIQSLQTQLEKIESAYVEARDRVTQLIASQELIQQELNQAKQDRMLLMQQISGHELTVQDLTKSLAKAREGQAQQAVDQQADIQNLTQAKDEQAMLAQQRGERIAQLETQLEELYSRHRLLNEEMIKVEGQVDLFKGLFLREPSV